MQIHQYSSGDPKGRHASTRIELFWGQTSPGMEQR